ncbi:MAG: 4-(cytidine 5'-diphospho)-2-C-methyl-D-erythritol kinase [Tissierellia bacterium]|nr:4-(cytidine 5'-diphospho)-2-C-methyl-D-erythritol kinase [Tissierellia bacterium]
MEEIVLESYGKINLSLDVLYRRDDGYHELNTIMQEISLKDRVILRDRKNGIKIECNKAEVPLDRNNLVYRAWEKLSEEMEIDRGIHIILDKEIPVAAGLAGGSSNAAAVLKGLNILWDLNLSEEELRRIGVCLGADIPFCIMGGTAHARGIGEELTKLRCFSDKMVLLVDMGIPISTPYVYDNLDLDSRDRIDINEMVRYIEDDDLPNVARNMENMMEDTVIRRYPIVGNVKEYMLRGGALGSIMSGSGPTVFGLFDDEEKLHRCREGLKDRIKATYIARTI